MIRDNCMFGIFWFVDCKLSKFLRLLVLFLCILVQVLLNSHHFGLVHKDLDNYILSKDLKLDRMFHKTQLLLG